MDIIKKVKGILGPVVDFIVVNKITWRIMTFLLRGSEWVRFRRSQYEHKVAEKKLKLFYTDRIVKSGFFYGMKYCSFNSSGSSIFPKLLGSYEVELYSTFLKLQRHKYKYILDVGCAEGYYAVGLALRFPDAKIYGFDINKEALSRCKELAQFNNVEDRVLLSETCTSSTLESFAFSGRSLIICDCEGYEKELFTRANIYRLKATDLVIELHPFAVKDVRKYLAGLFSTTHDISFISSMDNNRKIFDFNFLLNGLNQLEQLKSVEEGRPFTMEWLIAESKCNV